MGILNERAFEMRGAQIRGGLSTDFIPRIPVAFGTAWGLAALTQANHRVHRASRLSLVFLRRASSSVLGIGKVNKEKNRGSKV